MLTRQTFFLILLILFSSVFANPFPQGIRFERLETGDGKTLTNGYLIWKQGHILELGEDLNRLEQLKKLEPQIRWVQEKALWIVPGFVLPWYETGIASSGQSFSQPAKMLPELLNPYDTHYHKMLLRGFTTICLVPPGSGFVGEGSILKPGAISQIEKENGVTVLRFQIGELNNLRKNLPLIKNLKPEQLQQKEFQAWLPYTQARDQKAGWIVEIGQLQLLSLFLKENQGMSPTLFLRGGRAYYLQSLLQDYSGSLLLSTALEYETASEILRSSILELAKPGRVIGFVPEREDLNALEQFRLDGATLIRFGYPRQEVLSGMTFYNAKILQLDKEIGSLDRGKRANFLLFNGDPFLLSSQLTAVFLDGEFLKP